MSEFDALHREVVGAKRVRMLWGAALLIAVVSVSASTLTGALSPVLGGWGHTHQLMEH